MPAARAASLHPVLLRYRRAQPEEQDDCLQQGDNIISPPGTWVINPSGSNTFIKLKLRVKRAKCFTEKALKSNVLSSFLLSFLLGSLFHIFMVQWCYWMPRSQLSAAALRGSFRVISLRRKQCHGLQDQLVGQQLLVPPSLTLPSSGNAELLWSLLLHSSHRVKGQLCYYCSPVPLLSDIKVQNLHDWSVPMC